MYRSLILGVLALGILLHPHTTEASTTTGTIVLEAQRGPVFFFDFSEKKSKAPESWDSANGDLGIHYGNGEPYFLMPTLTSEAGAGILDLGEKVFIEEARLPETGYEKKLPVPIIQGHTYGLRTGEGQYVKFYVQKLIKENLRSEEEWSVELLYVYQSDGTTNVPGGDKPTEMSEETPIATTTEDSLPTTSRAKTLTGSVIDLSPMSPEEVTTTVTTTETALEEKRAVITEEVNEGVIAYTPPTTRTGDLHFLDVDIRASYYTPIKVLSLLGVVRGFPDQTFRPEQTISRAEASKLILETLGVTLKETEVQNPFRDIPKDSWFSAYILRGVELGILKGYPDKNFRPHQGVSRVEFLKMLLATYPVDISGYPVYDLYPDTSKEEWYSPYVQFAKDTGLLPPTHPEGLFEPAKAMSRGEAVTVLYRFIHLNVQHR